MKNKLLFLIFLMFPTLMLADYTFIVENQAMVESYFNIFNAISALLSSEDYLDLLRLTFLLGGFFVFAASVLTAWEGSANAKILSPYGKYLITGVALLTLVFSYKEPMWVTTNNLPSFCATPPSGMGGATPGGTMVGTAVNLPSVLGFVFSTTNKIGDGLTKLAESAFSTPSSTGTASMTDSGGYLGALKQTIKIMSYNPSSVNLVDSSGVPLNGSADFLNLWGNFFSQCVYAVASNKGMDGDQKINELKASKNIFQWTQNYITTYTYPNDSKPVSKYLVESNGTHYECGTFYTVLNDSKTTLENNFACANPKMNGGVLELLTGNTTGSTASQLNEIAIQSGLINALSVSGSINSVGINGANFVEGKSRAEASQNNLASASYMAQMLPYIQMTMRAILYAFFPFVFVVMLLPGGMKVLAQYGQTILWIELWSPTAAVVNMFVNMQVKDQVGGAYGTTGLTYMSSINMLGDANTIAGVGAMLYLSIPALTWLILKGSGQMLGNVAGGVMGTFGKNLDSKSVAQDMAQIKASRQSGRSISDTINLLEQEEVTNKYGQATGFKDAGGMEKLLNIKEKISTGKNVGDIANVLSQGDKYVSNQATLGEQKGAIESGTVKGYEAGGGFIATEKEKQIQTETGLKTATANVNDAGGVSNVAKIQSELQNKEFNEKAVLNENTTIEDFEIKGAVTGLTMQGTTKSSQEMGKDFNEGMVNSSEQETSTKAKVANLNKESSGGDNQEVAKTQAIEKSTQFKSEQKIQDVLSSEDRSTQNAIKSIYENSSTKAQFLSKVEEGIKQGTVKGTMDKWENKANELYQNKTDENEHSKTNATDKYVGLQVKKNIQEQFKESGLIHLKTFDEAQKLLETTGSIKGYEEAGKNIKNDKNEKIQNIVTEAKELGITDDAGLAAYTNGRLKQENSADLNAETNASYTQLRNSGNNSSDSGVQTGFEKNANIDAGKDLRNLIGEDAYKVMLEANKAISQGGAAAVAAGATLAGIGGLAANAYNAKNLEKNINNLDDKIKSNNKSLNDIKSSYKPGEKMSKPDEKLFKKINTELKNDIDKAKDLNLKKMNNLKNKGTLKKSITKGGIILGAAGLVLNSEKVSKFVNEINESLSGSPLNPSTLEAKELGPEDGKFSSIEEKEEVNKYKEKINEYNEIEKNIEHDKKDWYKQDLGELTGLKK